MVGSRGKGSRSKSKGLAPGPVVPEPLKISFDGTSGSPLDGGDEKTDTLNTIVMPSEEEQMDEMISGFIFGDEHENKGQNVHEFSVATEMIVGRTEDVCTQEGTIEDVTEVIDGSDATADVSVEVNEEIRINPEEDEAGKSDKKTEDESLANNNYSCTGDDNKSLEVATEDGPTDAEGHSSFDHGVEETMIDNLENLEEPIKLDTEKSIGTLSDKEEEEHKEEDPSIDNEVKEVAKKVIGPKRKIGKKKVVKRKVMVRRPVAEAQKNDEKTEEDEASVEVGLDSNGTGTGDEGKSLEATTESVPTDTEGLSSFDHGIQETMIDNLEKLEEPVRPDTEKSIGTLSDNGVEENMEGNTSIANDVKEVTGQVNRPKRIVKKKLVKKKKLRKLAAVNEEMPQPLDENNASDEACKVDMDEHVNNEAPSDEACKEVTNDKVNNAERTEVKSPVKANRKRNNIKKKKALQGGSSTATVKDAHKLQSEKFEPRIENHIEINEPDVKNGEVAKSADRASLSKKNKKKNVAKNGTQAGGVSNDASKPKPSKEGKSSKKIDSMGMIFMCSSETKKDCYRYKVLGLPAGKKDMVMKIYKGMRLFLFDVDLRMMYGVYKAADPGGYNLEPRAFKSQFPSQVRFSILEDCVPLTEERFKTVLKDNYYTKNKFNCQLNSTQVKDLCKLFRETNRKAESQKVTASRRPAAPSSSARRDKKRKRVEDSRRGAAAPVERERSWRRVQEEPRRAAVVIDDRSRRRAHQEIIRHAPVVIDDRSWRRAPEEARHAAVVIDDRSGRRAHEEIRHAPVAVDDSLDRYHRQPVYERETYLSSLAPITSYQPLPALSPPRSRMYSFDRTLSIDPYRRDSIIGHRDLGHSSSQESRLPIGLSQHDLNLSYREPHIYSAPVYSTDTRREHYDYLSDRPYTEHYTTAEHRPPPPLYRRY